MRRGAAFAGGVIATVLLLGIAACTATSPVTAVSAPGLLGSAPSAPASPISSTDVCAAYPRTALASDSGWRISATDRQLPSAGASTGATAGASASVVAVEGCRYSGPDGALMLLAAPGGGQSALTALAAVPALGGGAIPVTGLGDAALAARDGVVVLTGSDVVAVAEAPAAAALPLRTLERIAASLRDRLSR